MRCCRFCKRVGIQRSPSIATASARDVPPIRPWPRRNDMLPTATTSWSILTSKNFSIESITTCVAERIADKRVLKLIRAFLNAGVMEDGLVRPVEEGTPQGGPRSPPLSNLVLKDLDKELERRGHRFAATPMTATSMFAVGVPESGSWPP